jgi:hypothetical protein
MSAMDRTLVVSYRPVTALIPYGPPARDISIVLHRRLGASNATTDRN